ncbi:MAG: hypothetical protein CMI60_22270 [Parvibaculum sp.]|nr:hypothetical protein [Parvibaculum sp.]|tara:strand:- start:873 stop:1148 length:276 start_codon:yes stop_codon:yes gene_type:complete
MGKLNPQSKFSLSIKELIAGTLGISSLLAVFFSLQSEIALAKELPLPEITKVELSYKDELIKNDFKNMRDDISDIKEDIKYIKDYIIRNKK